MFVQEMVEDGLAILQDHFEVAVDAPGRRVAYTSSAHVHWIVARTIPLVGVVKVFAQRNRARDELDEADTGC